MVAPGGEQRRAAPLLQVPPGTAKDALFGELREAAPRAATLGGVDCAALGCEVDAEVAEELLRFCEALPASGGGATLRLAHTDLGSGSDCEQLLFERLAEKEAREAEKKFHEQAKKDASKEKDFAVSAGKRRKAEEGIGVATARLAALEEELAELSRRKAETPWYALFSRMEARSCNAISRLDLSDCGLHATGLALLTNVVLELEHRGEGEHVTELALDGNDVGDIGMGSIASLLRLSSRLQALRLRNVGITERGVSQVLSGLVGNRSLALLDLRCNGLASADVAKAAVTGVRRFNGVVDILLD